MKRTVYRNDRIYTWEKFVRQDFDISHCLMGNLKQMLRIWNLLKKWVTIHHNFFPTHGAKRLQDQGLRAQSYESVRSFAKLKELGT